MDKYTQKDQQGQSKVVNELHKIFSACTLTIDQHYLDKSTVDIYVTATTQTGKESYYAIEAKDRDYNHNTFNDYILEIPKYNELIKKVKYKPLYVNTFKDNWMTIWNLNDIDVNTVKKEYRYLPKVTVEDKGKEWRWVYFVAPETSIYNKKFIS